MPSNTGSSPANGRAVQRVASTSGLGFRELTQKGRQITEFVKDTVDRTVEKYAPLFCASVHWSVSSILGRFDGFLTDEDGDEDEPEDATDKPITANGHGARSDRSIKDAWELESTSEEDVEEKDAQRPLRSHNQQALPYRADESAGTEQRPEVGHTARRRHTDVAPIAPSAPHNLRGLNPEEKALLVRRFDNIRPGFITDTQGTQGPKAGTADADASAGMRTPLQAMEPRRLSLDASRTPAPAPVSTPDTALTRASTLALTGALPPARGRRGSILERVTEVSSRWKVRSPHAPAQIGQAVLPPSASPGADVAGHVPRLLAAREGDVLTDPYDSGALGDSDGDSGLGRRPETLGASSVSAARLRRRGWA